MTQLFSSLTESIFHPNIPRMYHISAYNGSQPSTGIIYKISYKIPSHSSKELVLKSSFYREEIKGSGVKQLAQSQVSTR